MTNHRKVSIADLAQRSAGINHVWDALWRGESPRRIAVAVTPSEARIKQVKEEWDFELDDSAERSSLWNEKWRQGLVDELHNILARLQLPGDYCPAIAVPRFVHGQSQGITDLFGVRVAEQPDGNCYAYPLAPDPSAIDALQPRPLETSMYWGAVDWTRYARAATHGLLPFRNAVMTGPIDTANYLLGSTTLLEWVYTHPDTVHRLLEKITDVIIRMTKARLHVAGGIAHCLHFFCLRGGFDLCSEVRSLLSTDMYETFEAPYLRWIGDELGFFGAHSCGSWERTVPSVLRNPHIRAMNGQIKENDLQELCRLADGKIVLSIGPSVNVHARYTWPDMESFYRHILSTVPADQPFEVSVEEEHLPLWNRLHKELRGQECFLPEPAWIDP